ncbi:MAG: phenylalanine--tRNA ligase subunit alpha [Candidatus Rhabdochlamydia sp.]|nr:phenylalanyl-tRNA synthetase alpha chain [Chlamydiota bacterium]
MRNAISSIQKQFQSDLSQIKNSKDVELLKIKYLGKKGLIQHIMQQLKEVSKDLRPQIGKEINDLKEEILKLCQNGLESFLNVEQNKRLSEEKIDVTIPGRRGFIGRRHPLQLTLDRVVDLFCNMGFSVQYGPDIDSDYYNYEGLNFPPDHPARDMQDTFYITKDLLLRSHTSNTQLRVMQENTPPIRIIAPGTVYRNETISSRSHVFFHQVEGLYIDRKVTFADLLATMDEFWKKFFGSSIQTRFRPSYFPFVEPGLELDIACTSCKAQGCRLCKHTGWLEVAGAGMVHPQVLKNANIDPEKYSGYAWGMGIERVAMLLYGVKDIRLFTENNLRFLNQFA